MGVYISKLFSTRRISKSVRRSLPVLTLWAVRRSMSTEMRTVTLSPGNSRPDPTDTSTQRLQKRVSSTCRDGDAGVGMGMGMGVGMGMGMRVWEWGWVRGGGVGLGTAGAHFSEPNPTPNLT